MPNRSVHLAVAVPVGVLISGYKAIDFNGIPFLLEMLGGGIGAIAGGIGPDFFDPPVNPNHRGIGHSLALAVPVGQTIWDHVDTWQAQLREEAERMRELQISTPDPLLRLAYGAWEILLRLLAGALVGFLAGWGSHLALDSVTTRSLPLLC